MYAPSSLVLSAGSSVTSLLRYTKINEGMASICFVILYIQDYTEALRVVAFCNLIFVSYEYKSRCETRRCLDSHRKSSRTINEPAKVRPNTAERVQHAIAALNFYPDTNARALGSGRSRMYGLIISDITNPFFPELVKAFEDIAVGHGQEVLVANTNYDPERMKICVTRMLQRRVDGVAIMTSEMDSALVEVFSQRHIPLVFLDIGVPGPG